MVTFTGDAKKDTARIHLMKLSKLYKQIEHIQNTEDEQFEKILVIDLTSNKPKYGEIILAMQTIIVLKYLGYAVKVYIFKKKEIEGHLFEKLMKIDNLMYDAYNDIDELAQILLIESGITYSITKDKKTQLSILRTKKDNILFADAIYQAYCLASKGKVYLQPNHPEYRTFWNLNQELLSLLFAQYKWELCRSNCNYLVGDILKEH